MNHDDNRTAPRTARGWTRPDDYIEALAIKRTFRRARRAPERSQPETPRLMLSTLPFLVLLALLGVVSIAIILLAMPGNQPQSQPREPAARQQGVAEPGWFQEAQKEMHR